jgi:hypothetical protein
VPWIGLTIALAVVALVVWRVWPDGSGETTVADAETAAPPMLASTDLIETPDQTPTLRPEPEPVPVRAPVQPPAATERTELVIEAPAEEDLSRLPDLFGQAPTETAVATETAPAAAAPDRSPARSEPSPTPDERRESWGWGNRQIEAGHEFLAQNRPIEARRTLSDALLRGDLDESVSDRVRAELAELNERLVFSPEVVPDDPFAMSYTIRSGDLLSRVPKRMGLQLDWRLIQEINRISDPRRIREGQRIKVLTGPFHAVVVKRDYRMDIFMGEGQDRVYVRSYDVGLGEFNSTPVGRFRVARDSKLIDPEWRDPRTGKVYSGGAPDNPIGGHWVGLVGDEPHLADVQGYGIHGTIEPDSIGRQASMGCVRMRADDVAIVWTMLMPTVSEVEVVE